MNWQISSVQPQDFEQLFAIEQQAHLIPWSRKTLEDNQGEHYLNLKISYQNQIIGFLICQTVLDEATLFNIAIDPNWQGQGCGSLLLQTLFSELQQRGVQSLWLEVRETNPAYRLYEKLGFNQVDIRKNYYPCPNGKRENAIIMACYL